MKKLLLFALFCAVAPQGHAATIGFDLQGTAGFGLLPGNEPGSITGGTGNEVGPGITFDTVAQTLNINAAWGSLNGFTDLTGPATGSHLHGPTASINGNGFTETSGVLISLARADSTANNGSIATTTRVLTSGEQTDLFNGKFYINIHTSANGGGEMRGFLVAIPEPSRAMLLMLGALAIPFRRRR